VRFIRALLPFSSEETALPRYSKLTAEQIAHRMSLKKPEVRSPDFRKLCKGCGRTLPRGAFYLVIDRPDACSNMCRICEPKRVMAQRAKRRERLRVLGENGAFAQASVAV
jgi:hypothetical protein